MSTPPPTPGRPTVEDVALLLRARTKDSGGNEVGTFDDDTRPTADAVEEQIDAAMALVGVRFPTPDKMTAEAQAAFACLVAYRAALRIEKSYWPEQVRSDRSPYELLWTEYQDDLAALEAAIEAGGATGAEVVSAGYGSLPVGSWTLVGPYCPPIPEETTP